MTFTDEVRAWIADDVDPAAGAQLQALLDADAEDELRDRFRAPLTFGTAGLRGPLRAGPNGMNRTVVRRAAAGLAAWLRSAGRGGEPVIVGYDARHGSADFARDSSAVFAAAGFDARLLPRPLPTPVLAFAVHHFGAAAGVMVTASHNPAQDNGYKVYGADGAQIVPPADAQIEAAIAGVGRAREIPVAAGRVTQLDDAVVESYVGAVAGLASDGGRRLRIVHTAMHGVGSEVVAAVLSRVGFTDVHAVAAQERPDPDFPTVAFPNPEEPGALDLALAHARRVGADVVLANDPDADRCAVAVPVVAGRPSEQWRMLRGDEVGVLLGDLLLRRNVAGTYATTIVSSSMLGALARLHDAAYAETLTGFKWIMRAAPELAYGYEEALGYAVAPWLVRDKDGISAALMIAELAAALAADGSSLLGRLDELTALVGRHVTDQVSIRVEDLSVIEATMRRLRAGPPAALLGAPITVEDLLPDADVLRWRRPGLRVVVRPSGTEPKLKAYLEVVEQTGSADAAQQTLRRLRAEVEALLTD